VKIDMYQIYFQKDFLKKNNLEEEKIYIILRN